MTLNEYQRLAQRTASTKTPMDKLDNGIYGLFGEGGECADIVKKHRYQGHGLDRQHLVEECGDCLWYIAELAAGIGITLDEAARANVDKLRRRYPDGFSAEKSVHREA